MKQQYIYYNARTDILFHIPYKKIAPIHIRHYLTLHHHRLTPLAGWLLFVGALCLSPSFLRP